MTPDMHEEVLLLQTLDQFDHAMSAPLGAPIIWILAQAQKEAVDAMRALTGVDPTDEKAIRNLQNDIQRQIDLKNWMVDAVVKGQELYQRMNVSQRDFVAEFARDEESSEQVTED
jgi:hypothetical protein